MTRDRYHARGSETEFEPLSRGRVLRNKLGICRVFEMQAAESQALESVQEWALDHFDHNHRFTAKDLQRLHRQWLGGIYDWAGIYRGVNVSKGGFMFAASRQVPRLMVELERKVLRKHTPCAGMSHDQLAKALAHVHAELVLIHPFRDGNGRCARLLALLMALQAGLPTLDFWSFAGRGKRRYFTAIQSAMAGDYAPLTACFAKVIKRTCAAFEESA
ncbi:MAG TPA: Fic family protein [Candidatus Acidoferrum sp.]|nr:Fic family protein [Candidatus Acidoferrum sp.]